MNLPNRILSIDFESTGVSSYDNPLSLSAVEMVDDEIKNVFSVRIRPGEGTRISVSALMVQGLDLAEGISAKIQELFPESALIIRDAMFELNQFVGTHGLRDVPVVSHKASFDWMMYSQLERCTTAYNGAVLSPLWICTKTLHGQLFPNTEGKRALPRNLDACLMSVGLSPREEGGHDSTVDAVCAGRLYFALKKIKEEQNG